MHPFIVSMGGSDDVAYPTLCLRKRKMIVISDNKDVKTEVKIHFSPFLFAVCGKSSTFAREGKRRTP